jgi:hypothetical protein
VPFFRCCFEVLKNNILLFPFIFEEHIVLNHGVIGSRGRNQIKGMYGPVDLPVLAKDHKLSELYVRAAHEEGRDRHPA